MSTGGYDVPLQDFATGHRGEILALLVGNGWLSAGLYASPHSITPIEISAAWGRRVRVHGRELRVGTGRFSLAPSSMKRVCRWLDRQGVRVQELH